MLNTCQLLDEYSFCTQRHTDSVEMILAKLEGVEHMLCDWKPIVRCQLELCVARVRCMELC